MTRNLIKCNSINYRQGYIEVLGNIHDGCINIETTQVHPDVTNLDSNTISLADEDITASTEVELSINEAEILVEQLLTAINVAKCKNNA
ncbi:MAG: hypothetical protein ACI8WB_006095 [Phenylobacterium sp.]|jgi:hypothetical protein